MKHNPIYVDAGDNADWIRQLPGYDRLEEDTTETETKKSWLFLRRLLSKHPGPGGSPVHATGTDQSIHGSWATGLSAPRLHRALQEGGGFTIHDPSGQVPTSGWVVALSKDTEYTFDMNLPPERWDEEIRRYRAEHWKELQDPSTFFGGWVDEGKVYLDISQVVDDRDEAVRRARERDQLAIFHLDDFTTYWVKGA